MRSESFLFNTGKQGPQEQEGLGQAMPPIGKRTSSDPGFLAASPGLLSFLTVLWEPQPWLEQPPTQRLLGCKRPGRSCSGPLGCPRAEFVALSHADSAS